MASVDPVDCQYASKSVNLAGCPWKWGFVRGSGVYRTERRPLLRRLELAVVPL